ncbi:hypothetical protein [Caballeronia sp. dw_19]|uniref:hypothetical protein n=1 Tax=unclassified Caballeronia TaxID=2646786 RepID=UPI001BD40188|nr:hypothetical protein [Caballeronia sp. dw_19]
MTDPSILPAALLGSGAAYAIGNPKYVKDVLKEWMAGSHRLASTPSATHAEFLVRAIRLATWP